MKPLMLVPIVLLIFGCTTHYPYRTDFVQINNELCSKQGSVSMACAASATRTLADDTPELDSHYELHFVEFDDQGWLHNFDAIKNHPAKAANQSQIDHLMNRLNYLMQSGTDINIVLYAHGWKHHANSDDNDVQNFRRLLESVTAIERGHSRNPRRTVGIYIGWRGKSWDVPEPFVSFTFWTRKNAALRVANGSAQELLSRLTAVQRHYNSPDQSNGCGVAQPVLKTVSGQTGAQRCKIRMLMIGHSFGAWILYSAIHGSLIESLNIRRDIPQKDIRNKRAERVADLVILINPAFEASRYESLHRSAQLYRPNTYEAPLIVTVTSRADWATRYAFPTGRFFNTIFELPVASEAQWEAMNHTPGHLERYVTHRLTLENQGQCPNWALPDKSILNNSEKLADNKSIEIANNNAFFNRYGTVSGLLKPNWVRQFCGGTVLTQLGTVNQHNNDPNMLAWNVQTDDKVINGHNDIMQLPFREFIRQLYSDVWRSERNNATR